nr:hypothetical protein [Pseudarthrobacter psychrotolerans]
MTAQTPAKRNMGGRLVPMKSAAAATSSRLATYSVMLMFCRSRFSRRAWRSAGVSGYVWKEAAGNCGGIPGGTGAMGDSDETDVGTDGAGIIIRAGATGDDPGGIGETSAKGDAGTWDLLTSAGTDAACMGTLLTAAVVPSLRGMPSHNGESALTELSDSVTAGPGWPDA